MRNRMTAGNDGAGYFEEMAHELLTVPLRTLNNGDVDNTVWDVLARALPGDEDTIKIGWIEIVDSFVVS